MSLRAARHMRQKRVHVNLGADYYLTRVLNPERKIDRLTHELQALGYKVTLTAA